MTARPSMPALPRLGGIVLLLLTGALSTGPARPPMYWGPATLCLFLRFTGYTATHTHTLVIMTERSGLFIRSGFVFSVPGGGRYPLNNTFPQEERSNSSHNCSFRTGEGKTTLINATNYMQTFISFNKHEAV